MLKTFLILSLLISLTLANLRDVVAQLQVPPANDDYRGFPSDPINPLTWEPIDVQIPSFMWNGEIKFKPFPQIQKGQSIWSAVTPQYVPSKNARAFQPPKVETVAQPTGTPNKDKVRNQIWKWMGTPIGKDLPEFNNFERKEQITPPTKQQKQCYLKTFDYSNPTEDLINSDQPTDIIYPGSFVQGKKIESGSTILQKLPISTTYRHQIRIGGNGNFVPRWASSSEAGDVNRAIKQAIWDSKGFYSSDVFLKLVKSSEITQLMVNLNINAKIAKILDISGGFTGSWTTKRNKFFITMLQGIVKFFPDKIVLDNSVLNDPVGVFLKQSFTLEQAKVVEDAGYWGRENIPCFINQVTYGRLMIISIEENERTKKLYGQLKASLSGIGSLNMSTTMTQMFQDSTTKVFSVGPFSPVQVTDLKAGNWTTFFNSIPANAQSIQSIVPIAFRVQDFKGQNVKVSNRLQYEQVQCQTKSSKNIKIQLANVYKSAILSIKKSGQMNFFDFGSIGEGDSPIWDITTSLTSGDNDELRVANTGSRTSIFDSWNRKVRLLIWVDGNIAYHQISQCWACHSQIDAFRCKIDKYSGSISCSKKP